MMVDEVVMLIGDDTKCATYRSVPFPAQGFGRHKHGTVSARFYPQVDSCAVHRSVIWIDVRDGFAREVGWTTDA